MDSLKQVRLLGFRRWYERQLIESHAYFVTCFVCMILVAAMLEVSNVSELRSSRLLALLAACAGVAGCILSWNRYKRVLFRAERLAEAANCPQCGAYGQFRIVGHGGERLGDSAGRRALPDDQLDGWLRVRCKGCNHEWRIE
jgi:hypothetical protein